MLFDLGLVVAAAAAFLLLGRPLRVPPLLAFMLAGLLLGPATGLLGPDESLAVLSELGIAMLLFLVGLELSLARIREVGRVAFTTATFQVVVTTLIGTSIARPFGFGWTDALLLGVAIAFSSTVVVVKLLEHLGGVASAHGRLTVGVLLVEDMVVAVVLTLLSGLGGADGIGSILAGLGRSALGIATLGAAAWAGVRWLLPGLLRWIAASGEVLFVVSLTWCFAFIVGAEAFHVSIEMGAFIAGLALAQLPYADELVRRVHPLADFLLAVFFVTLGAGLDPAAAIGMWPAALALSLLVVVLRPLLVTLVLVRGQGGRTAFLTGITLGQVSEFGFVLMALAAGAGLVSRPELPALLGVVGLVTMAVSAVVVPLAPALYRRLGAILPRFHEEPAPAVPPRAGHVVVVGMNTLGRLVVRRLHERGEDVVAVDTDPLKLEGLPATTVFGSAESPAVLREAGVAGAKLVVAAPQIEETNALLAYRCSRLGVPVSVHAFDPALVDELLEIGADHLMISKVDGIRLVEQELRRLEVIG